MRDIMAGVDEKDRECLLIYKPLVYDSHLSCVCLAEMSRPMDFSGRCFQEWFPYASSRFDSGYMFGVCLRLLLEDFHIFYVTVGSHWKSGHYFNKQLL